MEDKAREAIEHIKQKEILTKTRLGPFQGTGGFGGGGVCVKTLADNPMGKLSKDE